MWHGSFSRDNTQQNLVKKLMDLDQDRFLNNDSI